MNPPPLPTLNQAPGRSLCPKQVCWLVGVFLHLVCAKIPAAVEFQAKVVKADGWMSWRASPDDTGLLQSYLKSFNYFLWSQIDQKASQITALQIFSWILSFQKNHHQRQIVTFLGPTGILPMSCLPALVIHRHQNTFVLLEAPFALEGTVLYLSFFSTNIFTFLPLLGCLFHKYMQTVAKPRRSAKCRMSWERPRAEVRRSQQGGILLLPSHGLLWGQDFT